MNELLGDAVAEVVLLRITAQARKRQHGNRLSGWVCRLRRWCSERRSGRLLAYLAHRRNELVATARHGDDEALSATAVAERTAERGHNLVEVVLLDNHIRPDRRDQRRFVQQFTAVLDQEVQGIERFGGELDHPAVAARGQPPLRGNETEVPKLVHPIGVQPVSHFSPASEGFRKSQGVPKPLQGSSAILGSKGSGS